MNQLSLYSLANISMSIKRLKLGGPSLEQTFIDCFLLSYQLLFIPKWTAIQSPNQYLFLAVFALFDILIYGCLF